MAYSTDPLTKSAYMASPSGFAYTTRKNGDVIITHYGRQAAVLRGATAEKFLAQIGNRDPQELMARLTGNYKRGNQRK
jgi:hypothetical protein